MVFLSFLLLILLLYFLFYFIFVVCLFFEAEVSSCSGWPETYSVTQAGFNQIHSASLALASQVLGLPGVNHHAWPFFIISNAQ